MPQSNPPRVVRIGGMEWHRNAGGVGGGSGGSKTSNELRSPSLPNVFFRPEQQDKENAPLCIPWTEGKCKGMRGNTCPRRHHYQQGDIQPVQPRPDTSNPELQFSSPICLKIRKEVARERREEVDLETGRRRSWVETREFDILDLTGESPVSKPRKVPLTVRSPNILTSVIKDVKVKSPVSFLRRSRAK